MKANTLFAYNKTRGSWWLGRWWGVAMHAHWSLLLFIPYMIVTRPSLVFAPMAAAASIFIMLVHELGHAAVARWRGVPVYEINLLFLHGNCVHANPHSEEDDVFIAWGGVLAQLLLALVAGLAIWLLPASLSHSFWLAPWLWAFTITNLYIAAFNLFPIRPLDGATAWRAIPLLREHWRLRAARRAVTLSPRQQRQYEKRAEAEVIDIIERMKQRDRSRH